MEYESHKDLVTKLIEAITIVGYKVDKRVKFINFIGNLAFIDIVCKELNIAVSCMLQNVNGTVYEKVPYKLHQLMSFTEVDNKILVLAGNYWDINEDLINKFNYITDVRVMSDYDFFYKVLKIE